MREISTNLGKLILRLGIGGLILFHGVNKVIYGFGVVKGLLASKALPEILWIGAFIGEVIAPIFIIIGLLTRISSLLVFITMIFSIFLAYYPGTLSLGKGGVPIIELNLLYAFSSLAIFFIGSGRYSVYRKGNCILS